MGFLSQRVERSELAAGDHIYTWRAGFLYAHHGIYVGGKKVVHFTATEGSTDATTRLFAVCTSSSICPTVCTNQDIPDCGFHKSSGVFLSCLDCFLGNGLLYRFEYGRRSLVLLAKLRGGTCTTAESDPPETVIRRAMDMLHDGFGKYDLFNRNCEDFAKYCKTGYVINPTKAYQVACRLGLGTMGLAAVLNPTVPVGLSLGMGVNLVSRYANDIGVRREVNTWLKKMCKTWGCKLA